MTNKEKEEFSHINLAPYIQKSTALIGVKRSGGGNSYRHCFAVLGCLIDYHYIKSSLLKASILHDIIEDYPDFKKEDIINLDSEGLEVYHLVDALSKKPNQSKIDYLKTLSNITTDAKIIKCADRICNLIDVNIYTFGLERTIRMLKQTEEYILPLAQEVNQDMYREMKDLVRLKYELVDFYQKRLCLHKTKLCQYHHAG